MKCTKVQKMISDHIDGQLILKQDRLLKQHLQHCPQCLSLYNDLNKMVAAAGNLNRLQPSKDMWPSIQAHVLNNHNTKSSGSSVFEYIQKIIADVLLKPRLFVPLVTAAVGIVLIVTGLPDPEDPFITPEKENKQIDMIHYNAMELQYHYAIEELNQAIGENNEITGKELTKEFRINLNILNASISEYREVIRKDPSNPDLRYYLLNAYKKKKDLLYESYLTSKL